MQQDDLPDGFEKKSTPSVQDLQFLYGLYAEYDQQLRIARLSWMTQAETRKRVEAERTETFEEFVSLFGAMDPDVRIDFIRRITVGWEIAKMFGNPLLDQLNEHVFKTFNRI